MNKSKSCVELLYFKFITAKQETMGEQLRMQKCRMQIKIKCNIALIYKRWQGIDLLHKIDINLILLFFIYFRIINSFTTAFLHSSIVIMLLTP